MKKALVGLAAASVLLLTACETDATTARRNLDTAAEQFEVERRIIFINGITDNYMLEVTGRCSYEAENNQVVVICATGPGNDEFVKHSLVRSDNVTVVVEQLDAVPADVYRHRIVFKPEAIIPNVDLETSFEDDLETESRDG